MVDLQSQVDVLSSTVAVLNEKISAFERCRVDKVDEMLMEKLEDKMEFLAAKVLIRDADVMFGVRQRCVMVAPESPCASPAAADGACALYNISTPPSRPKVSSILHQVPSFPLLSMSPDLPPSSPLAHDAMIVDPEDKKPGLPPSTPFDDDSLIDDMKDKMPGLPPSNPLADDHDDSTIDDLKDESPGLPPSSPSALDPMIDDPEDKKPGLPSRSLFAGDVSSAQCAADVVCVADANPVHGTISVLKQLESWGCNELPSFQINGISHAPAGFIVQLSDGLFTRPGMVLPQSKLYDALLLNRRFNSVSSMKFRTECINRKSFLFVEDGELSHIPVVLPHYSWGSHCTCSKCCSSVLLCENALCHD